MELSGVSVTAVGEYGAVLEGGAVARLGGSGPREQERAKDRFPTCPGGASVLGLIAPAIRRFTGLAGALLWADFSLTFRGISTR